MRRIKQMEEWIVSLREMEWDGIVPEEDIVETTPMPWLSNPRCKWKTKRYWWNNGTDEALLQNCPEGWVRGRIPDRIKNFKAKVGAQKGIAKNTNRRRDSKGRLLPNK